MYVVFLYTHSFVLLDWTKIDSFYTSEQISSRIAALEISAASRRKELKYAKNCIGCLGLFCSSLDMKDSSDTVWTVTDDTIEKDVVPILDRLKGEVVKNI